MNDSKDKTKELIALHNKAPYVFTLWTEDCKFIDCNDAALKFFGVKSKKEYAENTSCFIPKFQSDDSESLETVEKHFKKCLETECFYNEFIMEKPNHTQVPVYVYLQKIKILDIFFVISYHFILSANNSTQKQIEIRNKLLKSLNKISELALKSFDVDTVDMNKMMYDILKSIGSAGRADRCYIWENYYPPDSSLLYMRQIYEWVDGVDSVHGTELIDYVTYEPSTYDILSAGKVLNAIIKDMDDYNRMILEDQGIKSILIAPVHIEDNFWGFIGFDNCHSEELWEDFEEEILRTASLITATIVSKFEKMKKKR